MRVRIRDTVHEGEARLSGDTLTLTTPQGATTWTARHVAGPEWSLSRDGAQHVAFVARDRRSAWVHVLGRAWRLEPAERAAAPGGAADGTVLAPMTGKVLEVLAKTGDAVTLGQPLLVLSAMKMRLELKAPRDGRVAKLEARAGEQVEGGAVLAVIE